MKVGKIQLQTIIDELIEDLGLTDTAVIRDLFTRWGYEILKTMPYDDQLVHAIELIQISSYKGVLPEGWRIIEEVGAMIGTEKASRLKAHFSKFRQPINEEGCELEISILCPKCHKHGCSCKQDSWVVDMTSIMHTNFPSVDEFNTQFGSAHTTNSMFQGDEDYMTQFQLIQPSINYTDMYKQHLPECINLCTSSEQKYFIQNNMIETTFKEGVVLFSYLGYDFGEDGDIQVPDLQEAIDCVKEYMIYKHFRKDFLRTSSRESQYKYKESESLYRIKQTEARSKLTSPSYAEISQLFKNSRLNKLSNAYGNFLKNGIPKRNLSRYNIYKSR